MFQRLRRFRIFLKPAKCELFASRVLWCGHLIDAEGIAINPAFLSAVREIPVPENAATLRQFLASANWVRGRIPQFAELVTPLQELLVQCLAKCKRKTTRVAAKALLKDEWTEIHAKSFQAIKDGVANAVKLAHVRDDATLCLFTDASDLFFGAVLTQISADVFDAEDDLNTWPHEPLGFISGAFKNAQLRWSVCDKEGYAIKIACEKFSHLLIRELFIPESAYRLQQRLIVVAHAGAAGHRGQTVTLQGLRAKFVWTNMEEHVRQFVRSCLLCCKTRAGTVDTQPL